MPIYYYYHVTNNRSESHLLTREARSHCIESMINGNCGERQLRFSLSYSDLLWDARQVKKVKCVSHNRKNEWNARRPRAGILCSDLLLGTRNGIAATVSEAKNNNSHTAATATSVVTAATMMAINSSRWITRVTWRCGWRPSHCRAERQRGDKTRERQLTADLHNMISFNSS